MRTLRHAIIRFLVGKLPVAMNIASIGGIVVSTGVPALIENVSVQP